MNQFQQSQALTSHFESFWSIVSEWVGNPGYLNTLSNPHTEEKLVSRKRERTVSAIVIATEDVDRALLVRFSRFLSSSLSSQKVGNLWTLLPKINCIRNSSFEVQCPTPCPSLNVFVVYLVMSPHGEFLSFEVNYDPMVPKVTMKQNSKPN